MAAREAAEAPAPAANASAAALAPGPARLYPSPHSCTVHPCCPCCCRLTYPQVHPPPRIPANTLCLPHPFPHLPGPGSPPATALCTIPLALYPGAPASRRAAPELHMVLRMSAPRVLCVRALCAPIARAHPQTLYKPLAMRLQLAVNPPLLSSRRAAEPQLPCGALTHHPPPSTAHDLPQSNRLKRPLQN